MPILMTYPDGSWIRFYVRWAGAFSCEMNGWVVVVTRRRVTVVIHTLNTTQMIQKKNLSREMRKR